MEVPITENELSQTQAESPTREVKGETDVCRGSWLGFFVVVF